MDFTPTETEREAGALAAQVLADTAVEPTRAWAALAETGLLALGVPERLGGAGLGMTEVAAVVREVGRAGSRAPAWSTLTTVLPTLLAAEPDETRDDLACAVAAGEALVTAALHEPSAPMTESPATTAEHLGGTWRLDGVKTAVPFAAVSERILVPASLPGGDVALFVVDPTGAGVRVTPVHTASGAPEAVVRLESAPVDPPLDTATAPGESLRTLHRHALAGAAVFGHGLLAGALALTKDHVATREQFGRPLATFQAVAQQIADVYVAARTVGLAADSAVWRLATATQSDADTDLAVAAYWLADQAPAAVATCHHLHGGVGLDETYPLHRYSSLLKDLVRGIGGVALRLDRVARPRKGTEWTSRSPQTSDGCAPSCAPTSPSC
ncbi:hypothetical protein BJF85_22000 [Saccharomonospora sp. CUA-673]|uniref:acyl-CoA dehydrogenase family protein n=1 Tax=Saccharomonospora sp. CUA-673 TaxID=1904969 RepID=UPI00095E73CA|nr:acyl-CoA dehydrogenase family protein [Saccharomonospora sp. CUA-673]OLT42734.1 hypothetical protein BJF85_22000 [Saccharomonospora sp. CUA-673]